MTPLVHKETKCIKRLTMMKQKQECTYFLKLILFMFFALSLICIFSEDILDISTGIGVAKRIVAIDNSLIEIRRRIHEIEEMVKAQTLEAQTQSAHNVVLCR